MKRRLESTWKVHLPLPDHVDLTESPDGPGEEIDPLWFEETSTSAEKIPIQEISIQDPLNGPLNLSI